MGAEIHSRESVHFRSDVIRLAANCAATVWTVLRPDVMGARSYSELVVWQLANTVKVGVYRLTDYGTARRDAEFCGQIRESAAAAPALIAEGFGRYRPKEFIRYLRMARGELKETCNHLRDGVDRHHFASNQIEPLQRLVYRALKAATGLIKYLKMLPPDAAPNL
jgi:four helix bundle protein